MSWITQLAEANRRRLAYLQSLKPRPRLSVKPIRTQPKVVVKPVPKRPPLKVKPIPKKTISKVTARPSGSGSYNPQQAGSPTPKQPAPPQKTTRVFNETVWNPQTQAMDVTKRAMSLTEREWQAKEAEAKASAVIRKQFYDLRAEHGNDLNYDAQVAEFNHQTQESLDVEFRGIYSEINVLRAKAEQARINSKSDDEQAHYAQQVADLDAEMSLFQNMYGSLSNELNTQTKQEHDRNRDSVWGAVGMSLGQALEEGVGPLKLNDLFKYTIGEGSETVPSLFSLPARAVNMYKNVVDPKREVEADGERASNTMGWNTSYADYWKNTFNQSTVMTPQATITGEGEPGMADQAMKTFMSWDIPKELSATLASIFTNELLDPSNYIGGGAVKVFKAGAKGTKTADKIADLTKGVKASVKASKTIQKIVKNPYVKDLLIAPFKKYKSPEDRLASTLRAFNKATDEQQTKFLQDMKVVNNALPANKKIDLSVYDDFKKMSDNELAMLQRLERKPGTAGQVLSLSDKDKKLIRYDVEDFYTKGKNLDPGIREDLIDRLYAKRVKDLEHTGRKFDAINQKMKKADVVEASRFGGKDQQIYVADVWDHKDTSKGYNFRKKKTGDRIMPGDEFRSKQVQRLFESKLLEGPTPKKTPKSTKTPSKPSKPTTAKSKSVLSTKKTRESVLSEYKRTVDELRKPVTEAEAVVNSKANRARKLAGKPMVYWKDGVLTFNPAWYVNNEMFNIASGITEGGMPAFTNRLRAGKKMRKFDLSAKQLMDLDGFVSKSSGGGLKRRKFARWQENNAREGLYITRRNEGLSHDQAMMDVSAAFGNYSKTTNLGKGISKAVPFWEWQKFVTKRITGLPLRSPRATSFWGNIYQEFYEKPLNQLPDVDQEITDPDTGEVTIYNPRQTKKGKAYNPIDGKWYNTPFNAFTPDQISTFGINPLITAFSEISTNRDKWGNRLDSDQWWEAFAKRFPQYQVGKAQFDKPKIEKWLAEGSGFPKQRTVQPKTSGWDALKRFAGIPTGVSFDEDKFKDNQKAKGFRDEWFASDWSKENKEWWIPKKTYNSKTNSWEMVNRYDYDTMRKAQEEMAKKHGYDDLQNDIYGTSKTEGLFNKYDAPWTRQVKKKKEEAREITDTFWKEYEDIKEKYKGDIYSGETAKYVASKRIYWEKNNTFIKNPELKNLVQDWFFRGPDTNYKSLDLTDPKKYLEYREWIDSGGALREAKEVGLAKYKASPKGIFWDEYHRLKGVSQDKASAYYQKNFKEEYRAELKPGEVTYENTDKGKFWDEYHKLRAVDEQKASNFYSSNYKDEYGGKGATPEQKEEFEFWKKYFRTSPVVQSRMRKSNPEYFDQEVVKRTSEELDEAREERHTERDKKLELVKGFASMREDKLRGINKKANKAFGRQKALRPTWKVR